MASTTIFPSGTRTHRPGSGHSNTAHARDYMAVPNAHATDDANQVANAMKARKRTKTGCLTCRKRRIKCGEERPTCKNCTKSKRDCEGYIPRVVFKEPADGSSIPMQGQHLAQQGYTATDAAQLFGDTSGVPFDGAIYHPIAPRPCMVGVYPDYGTNLGPGESWVSNDAYMSNGYGYADPPFTVASTAPEATYVTMPPADAYCAPQVGMTPMGYGDTHANDAFHASAIQTASNGYVSNGQTTTNGWQYTASPLFQSQTPQPSPAPTQTTFGSIATLQGVYQQQTSRTPSWHELQTADTNAQQDLNGPANGDHFLAPIATTTLDSITEQAPARNMRGAPVLGVSLIPEPDDDWFDVDSEGENVVDPNISPSDLGMIIHKNASQTNGDIRSMTNFLHEPNILASYNPSYAASPLKDPRTARVFCHFITATGPTLHVCERHPSNPSVIFSGQQVPKSQQTLWSYTLPMLALNHQGLLHAMLALSSLHMAKLQQSSPTPSLRHYHYALRRVAKALSNHKKRQDPATLAATLLLGYYEVTTAEHNKWNSHLSGARELVRDIPYAKMSKRVQAFRRKMDEEAQARRSPRDQSHGHDYPCREPSDVTTLNDPRLDQNLISTIMGWDTSNDEIGEILEDSKPTTEPEKPCTQEEADAYEVQLDLYWWYAKQDMYQSVISGNRLLLSYDRWAQCAPRAAIGKQDAVYGSMDHLYLLLARLADFAGKDQARKKRAHREAQKAAKAARHSPESSTHTSPGHPPPQYGMIPDPGPVRLPSGFNQTEHDKTYTAASPSESKPLETAFAEAMAEWNAIAHAFDVFHQSLGSSYEPLSPEHMTPLSTPFGPAIYYRSYSIACVLCLYYCGRIILTRTQPSMPPAAMVASAVAAPHTASFANTIGRICAGIQPVSNTAPLNPHHGAALMDVCMGLFHAGIQYRDPAQRGWTILKLRDVARLTGWQTSALIASGCERAWIHFAELKKGPPYERTMNSTASDDRVAGRSRDPRIMSGAPRDNNDRRFVKVNAGTRVYWAMGILSVEEDMKDLNLGE